VRGVMQQMERPVWVQFDILFICGTLSQTKLAQ
jgi:hypothetical protein